jgi:hypothetical protein
LLLRIIDLFSVLTNKGGCWISGTNLRKGCVNDVFTCQQRETNWILQHVAIQIATVYMNRNISTAKYRLPDKKVQVFMPLPGLPTSEQIRYDR